MRDILNPVNGKKNVGRPPIQNKSFFLNPPKPKFGKGIGALPPAPPKGKKKKTFKPLTRPPF